MQITNDEEHAKALEDLQALFDQSDKLDSKISEFAEAIERYESGRWPMVDQEKSGEQNL